MSQPPPPFLLPRRPWSRVGALLAGAGRQRVAVAVLALAALLIAGFVWIRAAPGLVGVDDRGGEGEAGAAALTDSSTAAAGPGAAAGSGAAVGPGQTLPRAAPDTSAGSSNPSGRVAVHVAGHVRHPGLVRLPAGSRVQDAIRAAGGATAGADLDAVNLARKLTDGEQVLIPGPGDPPPPLPPDAGAAPGTPSAPLDLNTATVEQLDALPGVGEVTAGRIVAYRSAHPFTTVDELLEVPGIGQRRFEQLRDLVTVT
jgi:competence protein ComEA